MKLKACALTICVSSLSPLPLLASDQVGTLTNVLGRVQLYTRPSKTPHEVKSASGVLARYEDQMYYVVIDAKVGDRLEKGNVVRALPGSSARVVYDNGDQYNVASGTAFQVNWAKDSADASASETKMDLMYGRLRGIVSKGGPRSRLKIQTRAAVMGVRGTDFFIASSGTSDPNDGGTEVSIIRGSVAVTPVAPKTTEGKAAEAKAPEPIKVDAGFTANIAPPSPPVPAATSAPAPASTTGSVQQTAQAPKLVAPLIELRKTTVEDFVEIKKTSDLAESKAAAPQNLPAPIAKLEAKAVQTVMNDVKTHDPALYEKLQQQKAETTTQINSLAVEKLAKDAPKTPARRKPFRNEIEKLENDSYEKYFKMTE